MLAREAAASTAGGPLLNVAAAFSQVSERVGQTVAQYRVTICTLLWQAALVYVGASPAGVFYDFAESAGSRRNNVTLNASAVAAALATVPQGGAVTLTIVMESLGIHKGAGIDNGPTPDTFETNAVQVGRLCTLVFAVRIL